MGPLIDRIRTLYSDHYRSHNLPVIIIIIDFKKALIPSTGKMLKILKAHRIPDQLVNAIARAPCTRTPWQK